MRDKQKASLYQKKYRQIHKEQKNAYCKKWYATHKEHSRTQKQQTRLKALALVGNGKIECVRCGCNEPELLEINHKNGGGHKEYKLLGITMISAILYHNRTTDDLELLCKPCNSIHYLELKLQKSIPLTTHYQNNDWEWEL